MINKEKYLKQLPFWDMLTEPQIELVNKFSTIRHYNKEQFVHECNQQCLGLVYVINGILRTYLLSEEGREVTLFRIYENNICVLAASCVISQLTFDTHLIAEEETDILIISSSAFLKLTEQNIHVKCYMYQLLAERFSSVMWTMQQILFRGYDRRLASFLIHEYDRTGNPELRMTHEQLARHTSSAREVVARMLKRFSADHLVKINRGVIRLTDIEGLRDLADTPPQLSTSNKQL